MNKQLLFQQIEQLPDTLQHQVADFIAFLLQRYQFPQTKETAANLSEEEQQELENRYHQFKQTPATALSLEDLKNQLLKKYGV